MLESEDDALVNFFHINGLPLEVGDGIKVSAATPIVDYCGSDRIP
jgi:hypothetical protein